MEQFITVLTERLKIRLEKEGFTVEYTDIRHRGGLSVAEYVVKKGNRSYKRVLNCRLIALHSSPDSGLPLDVMWAQEIIDSHRIETSQ